MIDLKQLCLFEKGPVDGLLKDGRLVEFKAKIPHNYDGLVRQIVAIANTAGGFIIFGVDERTLSVIGVHDDDYHQLINDLKQAIKKLSLGNR